MYFELWIVTSVVITVCVDYLPVSINGIDTAAVFGFG
jgi:hypothetical protein